MPSWRRNLWAVAVANAVAMAGMTAFIPFFPDVLRGMGIVDMGSLKVWSGFLIAGTPLMAALCGPVWGALGDRYGRKPMVVRSLLAVVVFVGLTGLVVSPWGRNALPAWCFTPWTLLALRMGLGVFSGFIAPALTLATVSAPPERQARASAWVQSALLTGAVLGPALGAWTVPGGIHRPFLACTLLAAAATLLVAAMTTEPGGRAAGGEGPLLLQAFRDARSHLADSRLRALMVGLFLCQMASTMVQPVLRLHMEILPGVAPERVHAATGTAFSVLFLGQVLFAPLWARWADRRGMTRVIPLTTALTALAVLPQAVVSTFGGFCGLRLAQGAVAAGTAPAAYAYIGTISDGGRRGGFYALALSAFQLANVAGPALGGLFAAAFGTAPLFALSAGMLAAASLWTRGRL